MNDPLQQYCLRWNNHGTNMLTVFDELLQNEAFTDVTIACEDGLPIKCHRMVLAACSTYFQNLFTDLPCKHPVVVLKDVRHCEIKYILEYMYRGEVNVVQEDLSSMLRVAEALQVKGLSEANRRKEEPMEHSPTGTSTSASSVQNVHSSSNNSPPHSTSGYRPAYGLYGRERRGLPLWAVPGLPGAGQAAAAMLSGCYEAAGDMSPLRRKKLSSLLMNRDTPILRTVLGQGQADSSQPVSLVCHADSREKSNGDSERLIKLKNEPSEDAQSPYTDHFAHMTDEDDKSKLALPPSPPQPYPASAIATYVPARKQEWKRYKQYTRNDIMSAIEAVRNGMSALQAARNYKVPSRTLYDKVKKLGITTSRPFKRGANGGGFPYSYGHLSESEEAPTLCTNNNTSLEASFLQQAFEGQELAAMAAAARAQLGAPSPTLLKYQMRAASMTPSPAPCSETNGSSERDEDDQVEDLSISRKVIMPPMNQVSTIKKNEEVKEEVRMGVE